MKNKRQAASKQQGVQISSLYLFRTQARQLETFMPPKSEGEICGRQDGARGGRPRGDISSFSFSVGICGGFKRSPLWAINAAISKQRPDPLDKHSLPFAVRRIASARKRGHSHKEKERANCPYFEANFH